LEHPANGLSDWFPSFNTKKVVGNDKAFQLAGSGDIPVPGFNASPELATGKSPEPANKNVCATSVGCGRLEMDIVSHDVKKSFGLLLKKDGYVLEQLYSPLVVRTAGA
jgi:hypothetical protein